MFRRLGSNFFLLAIVAEAERDECPGHSSLEGAELIHLDVTTRSGRHKLARLLRMVGLNVLSVHARWRDSKGLWLLATIPSRVN